MVYQHSTVGSHRGKRVWKFLPTNYRTKREAREAGERHKKSHGYLYRVAKVSGGYRLYVMAVQK